MASKWDIGGHAHELKKEVESRRATWLDRREILLWAP
jgi:hypothetical protein